MASPNYPNRYAVDLICTWQIKVRKGYRVLLKPIEMNVEGEMGDVGKTTRNSMFQTDINKSAVDP